MKFDDLPEVIAQLRRLPNLSHVTFWINEWQDNIDPEWFRQLSRLHSVESLSIGSLVVAYVEVPVIGEEIAHLVKMPRLHFLSIDPFGLSDSAYEAISKIPALEKVVVVNYSGKQGGLCRQLRPDVEFTTFDNEEY